MTSRCKNVLISTLIIAQSFTITVSAQKYQSFSPLKTSSSKSTRLLQLVEERNKIESQRPGSPFIKDAIRDTRLNLIDLIKEHRVVEDDSLQRLVSTVRSRLVSGTALKNLPSDIIILNSPIKNAISLCQGSIAITVGLLGEIVNESQLAFVIAHEIAHYELNHVRISINKNAVTRGSSQYRNSVSGIISKNTSTKAVTTFRDIINNVSSLKREHESEADSLALVIVRNANYNQPAAVSLLHLLPDAGTDTTMNLRYFLAFDFQDYPLQQSWFESNLSLYHEKPSSTYIFDYDSLQTHPEMIRRLKLLQPYVNPSVGETSFIDRSLFERCTLRAKYQTIQTAFERNTYDRCVYHALNLLQQYPRDAYLTSIITKCLYNIHSATAERYLRKYTWGYSEELRLVNNFLFNIEANSLNLAYYFLRENFSEETEEHYMLMWRILMKNEAKEDANIILQEYLVKFPDGKYKTIMKAPKK